MSVDIKCKVCRYILKENRDADIGCEQCKSDTHIFLDIDEAPPWIEKVLQQESYRKEKLHCPKCKSKVGAFDFLSPSKCNCGASKASIWLTASKVDVVKKTLNEYHLEGYESHNSRPPVERPKLGETTAIGGGPEYASLFSDSGVMSTLDLNRQKVTEVARSLTRKGRECMANIYAGLSTDTLVNDEHQHSDGASNIVESPPIHEVQNQNVTGARLDLNTQKVTEVARHLTRQGREYVANLYAGLASDALQNTQDPTEQGDNLPNDAECSAQMGREGSADKAVDLNCPNVTEVARSLTRQGREYVANLYAGLAATDVFPDTSMARLLRETPATTDDDEIDPSAAQHTAGARVRDALALQVAISDALSEEDNSRESSPAKELPPALPAADSVELPPDVDSDPDEPLNPDAYTCSICLEIYYLPQQVEPCKHVFCDPCLRQVAGSSSTGAADTKCPLCRKLIKKCVGLSEFWKDTKALFPQEYQERHKVERKKRRHRPSLPGSTSTGGGRGAANRRRGVGAAGGNNVLAVWAGVCFVILFMMLGFTVFATTIGFVAWYFLEIAMDMTVDLTLELQAFSELFKTSIVVFCIDGGLAQEKWNQLYESVGRVMGAFTKLVHTRNASEFGVPEWIVPNYRGDAAKAYQMLAKITQTNIANYVVFGCLVTFIMYRLAKFMQARRV